MWTLIGENFLQLNVIMKHKFPVIIEDKPAMTSEKMWSNIGGIMSLWLGMNVMFVVEVTELVVCSVKDCIFKNRKTDAEA